MRPRIEGAALARRDSSLRCGPAVPKKLGRGIPVLPEPGIIRSGPTAFPDNPVDWFALLQTHPLLGLTFLNFFDAVNYALVGLIFLGLYATLRRVNRSVMTLALALAFVAIAAYFASNQAFAMLSISHQYATAATESQRAALLASGQALLAIHNTSANYGPGLYISFLFVSIAGLMIATVMLRSKSFSKVAAWMGILANAFGAGYYVTLVMAPAWSVIPLSAAAPFLLVWYLLIGRRLLRLASTPDMQTRLRQSGSV